MFCDARLLADGFSLLKHCVMESIERRQKAKSRGVAKVGIIAED